MDRWSRDRSGGRSWRTGQSLERIFVRSARDRNIERLDAAAVGVEPASARCFRVVASIDDISIISACACAPVHSVLLALPALPPL